MSDLKRLPLFLVVVTGLRRPVAASFPLFAAEPYHWLWGQYPAAGHYDHPPMVGWMSALFHGWAPGSELAPRSAPIVLGALSSLAIYAMVRDVSQSGKTAWRAAAICAITPMRNLNGVLIQPDNSLVLFVALAWWLFWRVAARVPDFSLLRVQRRTRASQLVSIPHTLNA
jgi:4-amino-4-deoxy-L-arabinose transferase-like glycosyltransferase